MQLSRNHHLKVPHPYGHVPQAPLKIETVQGELRLWSERNPMGTLAIDFQIYLYFWSDIAAVPSNSAFATWRMTLSYWFVPCHRWCRDRAASTRSFQTATVANERPLVAPEFFVFPSFDRTGVWALADSRARGSQRKKHSHVNIAFYATCNWYAYLIIFNESW